MRFNGKMSLEKRLASEAVDEADKMEYDAINQEPKGKRKVRCPNHLKTKPGEEKNETKSSVEEEKKNQSSTEAESVSGAKPAPIINVALLFLIRFREIALLPMKRSYMN